MMNRIQQAYDVFDKIEMPTGEDVIILKYAKGDSKGEYVSSLDQKQQLLIGQLMSKQAFPKGDSRYTLLPLQKSYDLVHSKTKEGKAFKKLNESNWFHNREVLLQDGRIIADPMVFEENEDLVYDGKTIKAKINTDDAVDTLIKAGLFKESDNKIYHGIVYFENGEASVWSCWNSDVGCFYAYAGRPSVRGSVGLASFGKTDEKVEVEKVEIAKREYDALLKSSKKLMELKPVIEELNSKLENIRKVVR